MGGYVDLFVAELILVETCSHTKQTTSGKAARWMANNKRSLTARIDRIDDQVLDNYLWPMLEIAVLEGKRQTRLLRYGMGALIIWS